MNNTSNNEQTIIKGDQNDEKLQQNVQRYINYAESIKYNQKTYQLIQENILSDNFTYSRRSALFLIFFPALTNIYYVWRPYSPLKNSFRFGILFGCGVHFIYAMQSDLVDLSKRDTIEANKIRQYAQKISYNDLTTRSFQKETVKIFEERKQKQAEETKQSQEDTI